MNKQRFLSCALAFIFSTAFMQGQNPPSKDPGYTTEKYDFQVKTIDGRNLRLSELKGKTVVLNFWATWCGPCRREISGLISLHSRYGQDGNVVFLGIAVWDDEVAVKKYIANNQIPYLIANDADDAVSSQYRAQAIPQTYLISPEGTLFHHFAGAAPERDLETKLAALLGKIPGGK